MKRISYLNIWPLVFSTHWSMNTGQLSSGGISFDPMNPAFKSVSILVNDGLLKSSFLSAFVLCSSQNASLLWTGVVSVGIDSIFSSYMVLVASEAMSISRSSLTGCCASKTIFLERSTKIPSSLGIQTILFNARWCSLS